MAYSPEKRRQQELDTKALISAALQGGMSGYPQGGAMPMTSPTFQGAREALRGRRSVLPLSNFGVKPSAPDYESLTPQLEEIKGRLAQKGLMRQPAKKAAIQASPVGGVSEASFNSALQKLISATGGKIKVVSGKRSTKRQTELWNAALKKYGSVAKARKWVAPPGRSKHEVGLAADLRGDLALAHKLAPQFGLHFPLSNENWHIELRGSRGKK